MMGPRIAGRRPGPRPVPLILAGLALTFGAPALGQEPVRDGRAVAACETLVSLRLLTAAAPDRDAALARVAAQPGCKALPRADFGAVAHRAMIGGAPFECLVVRGEAACLWVQP